MIVSNLESAHKLFFGMGSSANTSMCLGRVLFRALALDFSLTHLPGGSSFLCWAGLTLKERCCDGHLLYRVGVRADEQDWGSRLKTVIRFAQTGDGWANDAILRLSNAT